MAKTDTKSSSPEKGSAWYELNEWVELCRKNAKQYFGKVSDPPEELVSQNLNQLVPLYHQGLRPWNALHKVVHRS